MTEEDFTRSMKAIALRYTEMLARGERWWSWYKVGSLLAAAQFSLSREWLGMIMFIGLWCLGAVMKRIYAEVNLMGRDWTLQEMEKTLKEIRNE